MLSCGGLIHRQARAGDAATVVTVCAGDPPAGPISGHAARLHARWGLPPVGSAAAAAMVERRRAEDRAACARLGARAIHLAVRDVIYRRTGVGGAWAVEDDAGLFAGVAGVADDLVVAVAADIDAIVADTAGPRQASPVTLYAPLGIGDHVDHHLVRRAAERAAGAASSRALPGPVVRLVYYEDYPYADDDDAVARALEIPEGAGSSVADPASGAAEAATVARTSGSPRLRPPSDRPTAWLPQPAALTAADVEAKVEAVAAYASQISSFWPDPEAMGAAVRAFAARRAGPAGGFAERLWVRA